MEKKVEACLPFFFLFQQRPSAKGAALIFENGGGEL
jgi:hypothetical protein